MIERFHTFMNTRFVALSVDNNLSYLDEDEWKELLAAVVFSYNNTVNRMTSYSPHELLFGRSHHFPIDFAFNLKQNVMVCE